MLNSKLKKMFEQEKKEHPWLKKNQIEKIVEDHIRASKKKRK